MDGDTSTAPLIPARKQRSTPTPFYHLAHRVAFAPDIRAYIPPFTLQSQIRAYTVLPSVELRMARQRAFQAGAPVARGPSHNASVRINAGRHSGVGVAQKPAVVLNGPHSRHVQVLAEGAVLSVPSVIGDVNEHLRAIHGELPDLIGEDGFITDKNSQ